MKSGLSTLKHKLKKKKNDIVEQCLVGHPVNCPGGHLKIDSIRKCDSCCGERRVGHGETYDRFKDPADWGVSWRWPPQV